MSGTKFDIFEQKKKCAEKDANEIIIIIDPITTLKSD